MAGLSFLTYLRGIYNINLSKSSKVHNAIIQSIYDLFVMAKDDIDYMRLEMCLSTATGYWLDCWGDYFAVYRKSNESDQHYSKRIIDSIIQPKSTIPAIKDNIIDYLNSEYNKNYTREDVSIKEPWKSIAKYSHKGSLSNDSRFFSGDYYSHAVIDISVPEEITPELVDLVKSVKAAGVQVIWSVLNSYDIVSGYNDADDAWAAYTRHIQTQTQRNIFSGLVLSNSSPNPVLSGRQETWFWCTSRFEWYAKVQDKKTSDSIIITKKDLIGLLDFYTEIEQIVDNYQFDATVLIGGEEYYIVKDSKDNIISVDPRHDALTPSTHRGTMSATDKLSGDKQRVYTYEKQVPITDQLLESLELLDHMLTLSYHGKMSTSSGVMFHQMAEHEIYGKLMEEVERFKENNPQYYDSLQPPILNGERVMWLVERNKNWLWNTPTMTHEDFFKLWEPFNEDYHEYKNYTLENNSENTVIIDGEEYYIVTSEGTKRPEHTINSIIEFEDAYYKGYITFADKYQPPIVVGDALTGTPILTQDCIWNSPVFCGNDFSEIFRRQFSRTLSKVDHPDPTLDELIELDNYNYEGYAVVKNVQPEITITKTVS